MIHQYDHSAKDGMSSQEPQTSVDLALRSMMIALLNDKVALDERFASIISIQSLTNANPKGFLYNVLNVIALDLAPDCKEHVDAIKKSLWNAVITDESLKAALFKMALALALAVKEKNKAS